MRSVENKKMWLAMAALSAAVAISPRALAQTTYTWDSSGSNPNSPVDGSGNWDTNTAHWSNAGSDLMWPNTDYSNAIIGNGGAAGTITLQAPIVSNQLTFNPTTGTYSIAAAVGGDTLGVKSITANTNANITASVIAGAGLTFGGTGTVTLSTAGTIAGPVTLNGTGTLKLGAAGVLNSTNTALTINTGATLEATNTAQVATLAGSGNLALDTGSNLTIDSPIGSSTVFNGVLSGAGTLTKLAVTPPTNTVAGSLTLTAADPSFTGKLALTGTTNNQIILSGNANVNNATIAVTNTTTTGSGPELSLSNLATGLSAPIAYTAGTGDFRFSINAAAGANQAISSPINITYGTTSTSTASIVFFSNTAGSNLAVSSAITTNSTAFGQIVFRGSQAETFTGTINASKNVALAVTDAGSLYFNPASTGQWGQITLGGTYTIEIPNDAAIAGSNLTGTGVTNGVVFSGGKLQFANYTSNLSFVQANVSGTATSSPGINLSAASGAVSGYSGSITLSGSNPINFSGPGNFILSSGSNTVGYTSGDSSPGTIGISGTTVQLAGDSPFSTNATVSVASGATLNLTDTGGTDHNVEIKSLSGAGNVMTGSSANNSIQLDNAATTFSGVLSGSAEVLVQTGTQTLSGNNTFSGDFLVSGNSSSHATLALGNANALGTSTLYLSGALSIGSLTYTLENAIGSSTTSSSIVGTGVLTLDSDANQQFNGIINTTGASVNFISTSGSSTLLLGGNSTYTGATNVNSGTLQIGTTNALPLTTVLNIASGATLDLNGNSAQVGSLTGTGTVQTNGGTLVVGENASSTFSGNITGGGSLAVAGGNGILTLASANSYTGPTILTSGTLLINNDNEVNNGAGGFTFGTGQLKLMNYTSNLSFNSGNVILGAQSGAASTLGGAITGSGTSLTFGGPGTLILTSTGNTYGGGTTINSGHLQFATGAVPSSGKIAPMGSGTLDITGAFTSVTSALPSISNSSTGVVALAGDDSENIDFTSNGGFNTLYLGAATNASYTGTITPGSNGYNLGGGGATLTLPGTNALTGANNLNVANGTVALTGTNNLSGNINLNSGTLSINSDAAISSAAAINFNGGTLQFANYTSNLSFNNVTNLKLGASGTSTLNGTITGTSALNYQGPGTLLLGSSAVLPATSALTVTAGTLDLNGTTQTVSSLTGAGTINVGTGSMLTTTGAVNATFSGNISGGGTLAINNSSNPTAATTLTFTGANTFTGAVNFTQSNITTIANIAFSGNGSFNSASGINILDSGGGGTAFTTILLSNLAAPMTTPITLDYKASNNRIFITNNAGADTFSGPITFAADTVNGGNLSIFGNAGTLTVSSAIAVNVANSTFGITFRGTGTGVEGIFNGSITGNTAGVSIARTDSGIWVLDPTVGSSWGNTSDVNGTFEMGRADLMPHAGVLTMSGTSTFDLFGYSQTVGGLTSGTGTAVVTSTNGAASLTIAAASGATDSFGSASANAISGPLTIVIAGAANSVQNFGNTTAASNNANTYTGGTQINSGTLGFANINNLGSGPITFNGGTLVYNGTDTGDVTANGFIVNSGGGTINLGTNSIAFGKAVTGTGTLTKAGAGTLTIAQPLAIGGLTTTTGSTVVNGAATLTGSVTINTASILQLNAGLTAATLGGDGTGTLQIAADTTVAATAQNQTTLKVAALTIGTGATLDLGNGNLAVKYGTGADPLSTIAGYIKAGYDLGSWNGISPTTGSIISSASVGKATALGYADTGTEVDVKYTWYGDLNLDGVVDTSDLALMGDGQPGWIGGDVNYDGVVNADDFSLFMYGNASQNGSITAGVPEPTTLALALLPLVGAFASRRRRQS